jgi:PIN domain nuclease of toxin-antitoxin system
MEAIANPDNGAFVSAAALWEIAIKRALGKLDAPDDLLDQLREKDLPTLAVLPEHAWAVHRLPSHHSDPFDRLLIAQAIVEHFTILTADPVVPRYGVAVMAAR